MELLCLDINFNPVKTITYINLQWNRKYYACGQFSVQILANDYQESFCYIYTKDRREVGIVQSVEYSSQLKGEFVQLSGFFLEKLLDDCILYPTLNFSGNIETCARKMVTDYCTNLQNLKLGTIHGLGSSIQLQALGDEVGKKLYSLLKTQELSFQLNYDYTKNEMLFDVWKGVDRTQSQTQHNFVVFSDGWGNIANVVQTSDNSNYKNYAMIAGEESDNRVYVSLDLSGNDPIKKLFVDAKSIKQKDMSYDEYCQALKTKGREELQEYTNIQNASFDIISDGLKYLSDFNLGDKCDIVLKNISVSYQARIIEVNEVIKENKQEIQIVVGDQIPTIFNKTMMGV